MPKKSAYKLSSRPAVAKKKKLPWARITIVVVVLIAVLAILELTGVTHVIRAKKVPSVIPSTTVSQSAAKPSSGSSAPDSSGANSQASASSAKDTLPSGSGTANGSTLVTPYGDLVSSHHPSGANSQEVSICNTTPGATCYIKFTNSTSGQVTKLAAEVVGSDGSARWNWDSGTLTQGSWQVSAVASLNGQTKSVTDNQELVVQ